MGAGLTLRFTGSQAELPSSDIDKNTYFLPRSLTQSTDYSFEVIVYYFDYRSPEGLDSAPLPSIKKNTHIMKQTCTKYYRRTVDNIWEKINWNKFLFLHTLVFRDSIYDVSFKTFKTFL